MGDAGVLVALVLWQPAFAVVITHSETAGAAGGIEHVRLCVLDAEDVDYFHEVFCL